MRSNALVSLPLPSRLNTNKIKTSPHRLPANFNENAGPPAYQLVEPVRRDVSILAGSSRRSEESHEAGRLEMLVVRERFRDAEPTHDGEGNLIDDSGLSRFATVVGVP